MHTQKITYKKLPYKNLLCILTHKNCHTKNVSVFLYTQKILCNPRKKLLVFLPYKNYYVVHPYKNYHTKDCHTFFPIQKLLCSARTKNCHTFLLCIFSHTKITMYYTQKNHIQKMLVFFPYKNYYVVHTKNYHTFLLCIFPIQKITMYSHTQKLPYKKC